VLGERAHDALRDAHDDRDPEVRAEAALALAALGDGSALRGLAEALELPELQLEALDAIGELRVHPLRDAVAALASSVLKPRWLKAAAGRALCRLGDELGVAALREVLRGLRRDGRSYAAEVVGELGLVALVPDLVRLAQRPRGADPLAVAGALGALLPHDERARPGLERLARRSDEAGEAARAALGR
jgi:HEAT repeat protein